MAAMANVLRDAPVPNVSDAMRRRVSALLDAGELPQMRGQNLRLGNVVLQRTDGRDAPVLAEVEAQMRRRNMPTENVLNSYGPARPVYRGRGTYATDTAGVERMITRRVAGENRATLAGRRFFRQPYTRWIVHVPTYRVRLSTGSRFGHGWIDVTGESLGMYRELNHRGPEADQLASVRASVQEMIDQNTPGPIAWYLLGADASNLGDGVTVHIDTARQPTYSRQTTQIRDGDMRATHDTLLDRIVFGEVVFAEDMWHLHRIHEVSRRRSGECGVDVIVASAQRKTHGDGWKGHEPMMTAEKAAQALVQLAREMFPDEALAKATFTEVAQTAEIHGIDEDLRMRQPDFSALIVYREGMAAFLRKDRTIEEIQTALTKNIWRGAHKTEQTFAKAVAAAMPWCKTPRTRLLYFLRDAGWWVDGENVSLEKPIPNALEAVKECGTPVKLLVKYYEKLGVKLILMNGGRCHRVWEPEDWQEREKHRQVSVVLNVWSNHVSTYTQGAAQKHPGERGTKWSPIELYVPREIEETHSYDDMMELSGDTWEEVPKALEEKRPQAFWTTMTQTELEGGLKNIQLAFVPYYSAPGKCKAVAIPFSDKDGHRASVYIKFVPGAKTKDDGVTTMGHRELRDFCRRVEEELHLKLPYRAESAAVVGANFVRAMLVNKRCTIPVALQRELVERQGNRCVLCGDLMKNPELHHALPVAEGGTNQDVVLICRTCHSEETEKQQLKGGKTSYFESQLSPEMTEIFRTTPRPKQLCWGDGKVNAHMQRVDDFASPDLFCMDVVGCRSNALLSREYLPVGSPLDHLEPVFENGEYKHPLEKFTWLWVETEGTHSLYDGPHLYPFETVQVLMADGFLVATDDTLPLGWVPRCRFPSSELQEAWATARRLGAKKEMILATIGLWSKQTRTKFHARRTDCEDDLPGPVTVKTFRQDGTIMYTETDVWHNVTCLPFALLPLFDEQRHMYRARQLVAKVPKLIPVGCMVDGLFCVGSPEAKAELETLAAEEVYRVLECRVFQFKEAKARHLERLPLEQRREDNRSCYRPLYTYGGWLTLDEDEKMRPRLERLTPLDDNLAILSEATTEPLDAYQAMGVVAVAENNGGLVSGPAGVGKSQILRALRKYLEHRGNRVVCCAYTHAASRLVGGQTIASLLHKNTSLSDTWFLVDEAGLIPLSTLGEISRWKALGSKFVFFGDYDGQFTPFVDRWGAGADIQNSVLVSSMCSGLRINVSTYRRGTDLQLFNWFHGMYGREEIPELVRESRKRYPAACDPMGNPLILCLSHFARREANRIQNERLAPPGATLCEWVGDELKGTTMQPQSVRIWACSHPDKLDGIQLIGCTRGSKKELVVQGVVYCVMEITEDSVRLQMMPDYRHGRKDEEVTIPLEDVCSQLRPTHAMCYFTVQGRTVKDRHVVLMDTGSKHFSVRALIVGLSRTTHGSFLHIGDDTSRGLFVGERTVRQARHSSSRDD